LTVWFRAFLLKNCHLLRAIWPINACDPGGDNMQSDQMAWIFGPVLWCLKDGQASPMYRSIVFYGRWPG
jgi:hypothetical protein